MQMATCVKNFADDNNKLCFNLIGQKSEWYQWLKGKTVSVDAPNVLMSFHAITNHFIGRNQITCQWDDLLLCGKTSKHYILWWISYREESQFTKNSTINRRCKVKLSIQNQCFININRKSTFHQHLYWR